MTRSCKPSHSRLNSLSQTLFNSLIHGLRRASSLKEGASLWEGGGFCEAKFVGSPTEGVNSKKPVLYTAQALTAVPYPLAERSFQGGYGVRPLAVKNGIISKHLLGEPSSVCSLYGRVALSVGCAASSPKGRAKLSRSGWNAVTQMTQMTQICRRR